VLAPGPLDWLRDPAVGFEVLLASAVDADTGAVERLGVSRVEIFGRRTGPGGEIAVLHLESPSRHRPYTGQVDDAALARAVRHSGDVWGALVEHGALPDIRDREPAIVLARVADWERAARERLVVDRTDDELPPLPPIFCCFFHFCRKCFSDQGTWW